MKKKNLVLTFLIKIIVAVVFFVACFFNIFQKLDYRLYDSLFHFRKQPELNENIMLVKIDDPSILEFGEWPWSRDVIADALIRMKELGAYNAIFDIEYISPSKNGIEPSAEDKINSSINETKQNINELINQFSTAIERGYYSKNDLSELTAQLLNDNINPSFDELDDYIQHNISRDNDEYFAQALQFFQKAYLTINHENMGYVVTPEQVNYIKKRLLLSNVTDKQYLINIGNEYTSMEAVEDEGFNPALQKLMSRAYGSSFTNSVIDNDGVRRRMQLLYAYDGKYIPQLAFGPFLEIVKSKELIRQKDELIVKNATNPISGKTEDITIPLDAHGRILINWRRGSCDESFKNDSIINLFNLNYLEEDIIITLKNLAVSLVNNQDGSEMDYTIHAKELLQFYYDICDYKDYLLSKCTGYDENGNVLDGIDKSEYDEYFSLRKEFFDNVSDYINQNYINSVLERLDELKSIVDPAIISEYSTYINEDFINLKTFTADYLEFFDEMEKLYKNAYCIIGNTATSTTDNGATPLQKKFMNVGIHANILNTLLTQDFITCVRWYWGFIAVFIISIIMLFFVGCSNTIQNIVSFILYVLIGLGFITIFVYSHYYVNCMGSLLFLLVDYIACVAFRFYQSVKEKQFITKIAASFANKDTVDELRRNPEAFKTEGQKKCITALFSDIQKFSTFSENIGKRYGEEGPNKLIEILNEYLGKMSNEILRNKGNIDKYEGDAIISMFGAPDPMNEHTKEEWAFRCLDSAIRMKQVEINFNEEHSELFKPIEVYNSEGRSELIKLNPLQTRIGINTGDAFVGLMGSQTDSFSKLNYTMIGDTVNLASRLEGTNKAYNSWIMCSDVTWNMANYGGHKGEIVARKLDRVRVVGKSIPVQLYNILGFTKDMRKEQLEQVEIFNAALDKYMHRDFLNAGKLFIQANSIGDGDPTALVFAERCRNFIKNGVPENWDGVINLSSK